MSVKLPIAIVGQVNDQPPPPPPPQPSNLGLMYMDNTYKDPNHYVNPASSPGLTNSYATGIDWRTTWAIANPANNTYDWTYIDAAISAAAGAGKTFNIQVLGGIYTPTWFVNDSNATIFHTSDGFSMGLVWDTYFQSKWLTFNTALKARFSGHASPQYVCIGGPGRLSESFFASADDITTTNTLAAQFGYADGPTAWLAGTKAMIDMYRNLWHPVPVVLVTGVPFPGNTDIFQQAIDYGLATYPGVFGARNDGWSSVAPHPTDPGSTIIAEVAPTCVATGYQSHNAQIGSTPPSTQDLTKLQNQMNLGVARGARVLEVWNSDMDAAVSYPTTVGPILQSAIDGMNNR